MSTKRQLTIEDVEKIEDNLVEIDQIVSLVFLLYDDCDLALNYLVVATQNYQTVGQTHCQLILDWVRSVLNTNWTEKLLEALMVTECYAIIRVLGYSRDELFSQFTPHDQNKCFYLNPLKKALYIFAESLTVEETERIINRVKRDLPGDYLQSNVLLLEFNLLYWSQIGFIRLGKNGYNLDKFMSVLAQLDPKYNKFFDAFKSAIRRVDGYRQADSNEGNVSAVEIAGASLPVVREEESLYRMEHKNAGVVIIINQTIDRNGTSYDKKRLIQVWKKFGFQIILFEDLKHDEFLVKLPQGLSQFKPEHCCLVVIILAHGGLGRVNGIDNKSVEIKLLEAQIQDPNYQNIIGKPKILIIQACQNEGGNEFVPVLEVKPAASVESLQFDGMTTTSNDGVPYGLDFIKFNATLPFFSAVRDPKSGTWFIQIFCDVLEQNGTTWPFEKILQETKCKIQEKRFNNKTQVAKHNSTTIKDLYFKTE